MYIFTSLSQAAHQQLAGDGMRSQIKPSHAVHLVLLMYEFPEWMTMIINKQTVLTSKTACEDYALKYASSITSNLQERYEEPQKSVQPTPTVGLMSHLESCSHTFCCQQWPQNAQ